MGHGSCLCGKLQYEYSGEPVMKATCHCFSCRKLTGSTNTINLCIPEDKYHVTSGSPKNYVATHETGMKLDISFCGECGATISKTADAEAFKGLVLVQAGSLDDKTGLDDLKPGVELYDSQRVTWVPQVPGVPQMQKFE